MEFAFACRDDLPEIVSLFDEATRHMDSIGIHQWDAIYPDRQILLEDIEQGILQVGTLNGQIAVVFVLEECAEEAYEEADWSTHPGRIVVLHRLCVHPALQGRGIARKAMDYLEQAVRARGICAIRLDAFSQNPTALRLYESRGYRKAGEITYRKGLFYLYEKLL